MTTRARGEGGASRPRLFFGERFRVRSRRGNTYVMTFLHWGASALYVRRDDGKIARMDDGRLEWTSYSTASEPLHPVLGAGDEVLVDSDTRGTVRGILLGIDGEQVALRTPDRGALRVALSEVQTLYLLYRAPELWPGELFLARSRWGDEYRGALEALSADGTGSVRFDDGSAGDLQLDQLEPSSIDVLVPIPLDELAQGAQQADLPTIVRPPERAAMPARRSPGREGVFICCLSLDPVLLQPDRPVVVGRSPRGAQLVLPHPNVSRQHAEFFRLGADTYVRDLGSANGTFVGKRRVGAEPVRVAPGEVVSIPPFELRLADRLEDSQEETRL